MLLISGSITKMYVTKGAYASPTTPILEIINNDHIHLELSVFEKDIMKIKKGQKIDFKLPEASYDAFKAEVHLVGTSIESDRTIKVHAHIEEESSTTFLVGMFVEADIITNSTSAKALPVTSIVMLDTGSYVLKLDKKEGDVYSFSQEKIDIKETYQGFSVIESKEGFGPNARFLTKGAFNLLGE